MAVKKWVRIPSLASCKTKTLHYYFHATLNVSFIKMIKNKKKVFRWSNNLLELSSKRNILVELEYKIYISRTYGSKNEVTGSVRGKIVKRFYGCNYYRKYVKNNL